MKLYEVLYREISTQFLEGNNKFTQKELSQRLDISIANINKALKNLEEINAVSIKSRSFNIIAFDKLMLYWASHRRLKNDILYTLSSNLNINVIESSMPSEVAFTAYSAYKRLIGNVPADYSEVYVYATDNAAKEILKRFPKKNKFSNIFVLKADSILSKSITKNKTICVPISNVFVDLWNIKTWYAKEFVDVLSKKIQVDTS